MRLLPCLFRSDLFSKSIVLIQILLTIYSHAEQLSDFDEDDAVVVDEQLLEPQAGVFDVPLLERCGGIHARRTSSPCSVVRRLPGVGRVTEGIVATREVQGGIGGFGGFVAAGWFGFAFRSCLFFVATLKTSLARFLTAEISFPLPSSSIALLMSARYAGIDGSGPAALVGAV